MISQMSLNFSLIRHEIEDEILRFYYGTNLFVRETGNKDSHKTSNYFEI